MWGGLRVPAGRLLWRRGSWWSVRSNRFKEWVMWAAPSNMPDLSKHLPPRYSGGSWGVFPSWSPGWPSDPSAHPRGEGPCLPTRVLMGRKGQLPCGPAASRTGVIGRNGSRPECGRQNGVTTISLAQWGRCLCHVGGGLPEQSRGLREARDPQGLLLAPGGRVCPELWDHSTHGKGSTVGAAGCQHPLKELKKLVGGAEGDGQRPCPWEGPGRCPGKASPRATDKSDLTVGCRPEAQGQVTVLDPAQVTVLHKVLFPLH